MYLHNYIYVDKPINPSIYVYVSISQSACEETTHMKKKVSICTYTCIYQRLYKYTGISRVTLSLYIYMYLYAAVHIYI